MAEETKSEIEQPDPAAIFACALSLWEATRAHAEADSGMDLSHCFHGMDALMRHVMRIGNEFECWACAHVDFDELDQPWPYLLADYFGKACLKILIPTAVAAFDETDCLQVALHLRLPVKLDDKLPIPIDLRAPNPVSASEFREYRIQTVRTSDQDDDIAPFCLGDDPFDDNFGPPYFGIYGVTADGTLEHITDRATYADALDLLRKLAPGIGLPDHPVVHA